jgi:CRP-like cAMP-binding protein
VAERTFWELLDPPAQDALTEAGHFKVVPDAHSLMIQGDPAERVYILMEGAAKVCMVSDRGKETVLDVVGPGDVVGELEAIDGRPRVASVVAKGMIRVVELPAGQFRVLARGRPAISEALLRVMCDRLRWSNEIRAARGARERVVELLHQIALRQGIPADGVVAITPAVSKEEFANWAGTSRGSALRALSWLQGRGVIQRFGQEIRVNLGELHKALSRRPHDGGRPGGGREGGREGSGGDRGRFL